MPPLALLGIGMAASGVGSALAQRSANKGFRPVFPGLNQQGISLVSGLGGAGGTELTKMIQTGEPTDVGPAFQALVTANKQFTQQGVANLRERFGTMGLSMSSPAAIGEANFLEQTQANFMSILADYTRQAQEAAAQRRLAASEFGLQSFLGPAFTLQGPKGSVVGAGLGSAGQGLQTLGLLKALGFLSG